MDLPEHLPAEVVVVLPDQSLRRVIGRLVGVIHCEGELLHSSLSKFGGKLVWLENDGQIVAC